MTDKVAKTGPWLVSERYILKLQKIKANGVQDSVCFFGKLFSLVSQLMVIKNGSAFLSVLW
ncbi:hypothetical protein D1831_07965 [Lactiplantibacillus garii]|uniref:Uncharacterized protein n=1 Tax=Lactiplantibacillus garii TaxID=2306423 RepID=A0A3R8J6T7_9LACO|nr:hypothetical protein D1831_07965 [Lactiplantibacillus garii]